MIFQALQTQNLQKIPGNLARRSACKGLSELRSHKGRLHLDGATCQDLTKVCHQWSVLAFSTIIETLAGDNLSKLHKDIGIVKVLKCCTWVSEDGHIV